jgi:hypothetical protein
VGDPRLSWEDRHGIKATVDVLSDQLSVLISGEDYSDEERRDIYLADSALGRVEYQYADYAELRETEHAVVAEEKKRAAVAEAMRDAERTARRS